MKHLKKILLCTLLIVVGLLLVKKLASSSKQQGQKTNLSGSRNMSSDEADSRLLLGERRTKESATDIIHRLLEEPENAKMFHEEFQNILASDFDEVMAYLNAMKFPDPNSDHSFNQVMYVAKNLDHFFKNETFDDTVAALESIRGAPFLFEGALQEIISNSVGRHEGRDTEQYAQIYQWIKNNPETDAAQNGGTVLGGMLYLSDPENGWKKAMDLPEGRIRREAITALLTQRYSDDLTEASTILSQIDITPDLDDAMANLVRYGIEQDAPHDRSA